LLDLREQPPSNPPLLGRSTVSHAKASTLLGAFVFRSTGINITDD
jgi:hypothetical protein